MTRQIKFRCWDIAEQKMLYAGDTCVRIGMDGVLFEKEFEGIWQRSDVLIPMQFTGLKDRNGKDIFEGDIVKENGAIGVIYYIAPSFVVSDKEGDVWYLGGGMSYPKPSNLLQTEVIGNIYENPKWLEAKS